MTTNPADRVRADRRRFLHARVDNSANEKARTDGSDARMLKMTKLIEWPVAAPVENVLAAWIFYR
jgi:hypothetical protein